MPLFYAQVILDSSLAMSLLEVQDQLCGQPGTESTPQAMRTILARLMDQYATFIPEDTYWQSSGAIRQVCSYLRTHYREPVSVQQLARIAGGMSDVHFTRRFRQQVGMPPYAYLTYRRVEEAKQRLQLHQPTVQVALDVGFADQSHLTRQFKRITGITPGTYRRLYQSPVAG